MANINSVSNFGKILFIPTKESIPPLPIMSLLFLKDEERKDIVPWRAVCIDLEIDACGNSMNEAWENLKNSLIIYIEMEKKAAKNSIFDVAKKITKTAFSETAYKKEYFELYRQAKMNYTMKLLESEKEYDPFSMEKRTLKKQKTAKAPIEYVTNEEEGKQKAA
jgi:hypothetical protein